jgi:hypothetical protein
MPDKSGGDKSRLSQAVVNSDATYIDRMASF